MKKKNEINKISASEAPLLYEGYKEQLETNPQYSLEEGLKITYEHFQKENDI